MEVDLSKAVVIIYEVGLEVGLWVVQRRLHRGGGN